MVVTFVTSSRESSVNKLDDRRLNKQRIEANQILKTVQGKSEGWSNHPAVKMWVGHAEALKVYINWCIRAWRGRGKNCKLDEYDVDEESVDWPWWFTWKQLHLSHKCSLLRKNPEHYEQYFQLREDQTHWLLLGYIWPHKITQAARRRICDDQANYPADQVCDPIGVGAPAQYRWTVEQVQEWREDRTVNPKTGRTIKKTKTGIYADIHKAYRYYQDNDLL